MAGCKVIGILGGVGSGKSEAVNYLQNKYHAYVIKADEVAHRLYNKGRQGYKAVIRCCGKSVLDDNRCIDRVKLAAMLYSDTELLSRVNASIHPMVYLKTEELISAYKKTHSKGLIVYEAALISKPMPDFLDEIWYIHSNENIRKSRLKEYRGYTDSRIEEIITNQPGFDEYKDISNVILENNGTLKDLEQSIDEIFKYSQWKQR